MVSGTGPEGGVDEDEEERGGVLRPDSGLEMGVEEPETPKISAIAADVLGVLR